jgi:hypothetical protein
MVAWRGCGTLNGVLVLLVVVVRHRGRMDEDKRWEGSAQSTCSVRAMIRGEYMTSERRQNPGKGCHAEGRTNTFLYREARSGLTISPDSLCLTSIPSTTACTAQNHQGDSDHKLGKVLVCQRVWTAG